MLASIIPSLPAIDAGGAIVPAIGGVVVVGFVLYVGWGMLQSVMSGDGHFGIIEAYVGFVRHGKTMLAVQDCIALARGRNAILAANIGIVAEGVETVLLPLTDDGLDLSMLTDLALRCREEGRGLVLLIDEAGIVMPSRAWNTFPVKLMWLLQQSGKLMVEIRYTTQHPLFVDSQLRALTAVVHEVRCTPPPNIRRRLAGKRPWFMTVRTSMPSDFQKADPDKVLWKRRIRYKRAWEGSYDTDAAVLPAGRLKGAGEVRASVQGRSGLDPRLAAQIETLPQKERLAVLGALEGAGDESGPVATLRRAGAAGGGGRQLRGGEFQPP